MKSHLHQIDSRLKAGLKLIIGVAILSLVVFLSPGAKAQFTWPVYEPFSEYPETWANTNDATLT